MLFRSPGSQAPQWGAIFCGATNGEVWICEIDPSGPHVYHPVFAATGSGHPLAHAALVAVRHFKIEGQHLEAAKVIAYRAIENVCQASAYGVGLPVQMAVVTENGVLRIEDGDEEHTMISDFIDLWKAKEVELLGALAPASAQPVLPDQGEEPGLDAPVDTPSAG